MQDLFEVVVNHVMVVNRITFRDRTDALSAAAAISKGDVKTVEVYAGNTEDGVPYKADPIFTFQGAKSAYWTATQKQIDSPGLTELQVARAYAAVNKANVVHSITQKQEKT